MPREARTLVETARRAPEPALMTERPAAPRRRVVDPAYNVLEEGHSADRALLACGHLVLFADVAEDLSAAPCASCSRAGGPHVSLSALRAALEPAAARGRRQRSLMLARRELGRMLPPVCLEVVR